VIWLAYWKQLLGASVAVVALFVAYSAGLHRGDVKAAQAQAQHALALANAEREARQREAQLQASLDAAEGKYHAEIESLRRKRNPGAGDPVRVCADTATAVSGAAEVASAAGRASDATTAAGLVSGAVPDGADIGAMLRLVIERGDELSAQVRALQAAWPK